MPVKAGVDTLMSKIATKSGSQSSDSSDYDSSREYLKVDCTNIIKSKKRARDSPQKSPNKLRKVKKADSEEVIESENSSDSSVEIQLNMASLNAQAFAELLRDSTVKEAFHQIIKPSVEDAVKNSISALSGRLDKLETTSTSHESEIENLKNRLDTMEQSNRLGNLIVSGLAEKNNENLSDIFLNFSKDYLLQTLSANDITSIFRLGKPGPPGPRPRPVLVKFNNQNTRTDVYRARVHLRKMETGAGHPYLLPIFINEDLSPGRVALYKESRACVANKKLFSAWTFGGNIWAKQSKIGDPFRISRLQDLKCLVSPDKTYAEKTTVNK